MGAAFLASVLELHALLLQTGFDRFLVAMLMFPVLDGDHVMCVLLRQNLAVLDWLH